MRLLTIAALIFLLGMTACSDSPEKLFETAQFEEQQFNQDHAAKLYRRVIEQAPNSALAKKAKKRLAQLSAKP